MYWKPEQEDPSLCRVIGRVAKSNFKQRLNLIVVSTEATFDAPLQRYHWVGSFANPWIQVCVLVSSKSDNDVPQHYMLLFMSLTFMPYTPILCNYLTGAEGEHIMRHLEQRQYNYIYTESFTACNMFIAKKLGPQRQCLDTKYKALYTIELSVLYSQL